VAEIVNDFLGTALEVFGWLGVWNMNFMTFHSVISSSQLTLTPSFFRGVGRYTTNQLPTFDGQNKQ
jgi:hypothetical protein